LTTRTFLTTKILAMKKKVIFSFIILLLIAAKINAQALTDSSKSAEKPLSFSEFFNPYHNFDNKYFSKEFDNLQIISGRPLDNSSVWMRTRLQLNGLYNQDNSHGDVKSNVLNPLSQLYSASQSMKELKYFLGAVQTGAVGYLAYKHLKKYGFLKRK